MLWSQVSLRFICQNVNSSRKRIYFVKGWRIKFSRTCYNFRIHVESNTRINLLQVDTRMKEHWIGKYLYEVHILLLWTIYLRNNSIFNILSDTCRFFLITYSWRFYTPLIHVTFLLYLLFQFEYHRQFVHNPNWNNWCIMQLAIVHACG